MASSSSSTPQWKYDVFLSFRGQDTRKNFVSHLYSALCSKGIYTFKDDREIEKGDTIPDALIKAIHTSRFAVVVISEHYATSRWCLEELRMIMEFEAAKKVINVVPIFYKVVPSDVRYQSGSFATAFADMKRPETDEKVFKWREALSLVADLSGYVSSDDEWLDEAAMIETAVVRISDKLILEHSRDNVDNIFGMRSHMEALGSLLEMELEEEVRIIGISGMGGVGKTTIAERVYGQFSRPFSAHCFLNVKKIYSEKECILYLQQCFLSEILRVEHIKLVNVRAGSHEIKKRLQHQKVFVVLDDVDQVDQLLGLANDTSWFGPGSRIIITTRDKGLLDTCGVETVYAVKCLDKEDALQMFKQIVFRGETPPDGLDELLTRVSRLAYGLPSALQYYSLFCRHIKTKEKWEEEVRKFEEVPGNTRKTIVDILKSSYTYLSPEEKIAFLYVACLFNGDHILRVGPLLDDGDSSIKVLVDKSLVDISAQGCINMHALVEKMGREIVQEESKHTPQKQRILWDPWNVYNVLHEKTGTRSIEGLALDIREVRNVLHIGGSSFKKMPNVKFLKLYTNLADRGSNLKLPRKAFSLPSMLKLLHWDAYPLKTLRSIFSLHSLVELTMRYSKLQLLCNKNRNLNLEKLKRVDVSGSKDLKELPDLTRAMQLEELVVEGCGNLISIKELPQSLNYLNAHGCNSLKTVSLPSQHSIKHIDLSDCSQLNQDQELITEFLNGGKDEEASLRFACIPRTVMPSYFNHQSRGATIQITPNLVDFAACVMITCTRPFHLQFSKSSYSLEWEAAGEVLRVNINIKPDLYLTLETEEEEAIGYLVIISSISNHQAGNLSSTLQLPSRFESPPVEIRACGVSIKPKTD